MVDQPSDSKPKQRRKVDTALITSGLKSLYRSVIEEPIPDDLLKLLDSLDDGQDPADDG